MLQRPVDGVRSAVVPELRDVRRAAAVDRDHVDSMAVLATLVLIVYTISNTIICLIVVI